MSLKNVLITYHSLTVASSRWLLEIAEPTIVGSAATDSLHINLHTHLVARLYKAEIPQAGQRLKMSNTEGGLIQRNQSERNG